MIPVTKPYLPNYHEVENYLKEIWKRNWVTNNGPLLNKYELKLKQVLDLNHLLVTTNGTIALQFAIRSLNLKGSIITTPFSYVATTSSIVWENCKPIFVDIEKETLNIDHKKIEASIQNDTTAILATHCFGNACNINELEKISEKNNLKLIFDASHCFGTTYNNESIFKFGHISTLSLHATKIIHCIEGGAVITEDDELLKRIAFMRNFGHDGEEKFNGLGINGKNSELHAAVGLSVLNDYISILAKREKQWKFYKTILENLSVRNQMIQEGCGYNYSYYPIIYEDKNLALKAKNALEREEIYPRRYFYPTLNNLDYVESTRTPITDKISGCVLCLPLYHDLSESEQEYISRILLRTQKYG